MQFESAIKRNWFANTMLAFVPDMCLAGIVAYFFKDGWAFLWVFLAIELLPFPIWLMRSVFNWVLYGIFGKKAMIKTFLAFLIRNDFPAPSDYEKSPEDYFGRIMGDDTVPIKLRFAANLEYVTFVVYRNAGLLQQLLKITAAYESAIENYAQHLETIKKNN